MAAVGEALHFHQDVWLESVFFRVHTRCAVWVSKVFPTRARRFFEVLCALLAACGLGA